MGKDDQITKICILASGIPGSEVRNSAGEIVCAEDPILLQKSETFIHCLAEKIATLSRDMPLVVVCSGYEGKFQVQKRFKAKALAAKNDLHIATLPSGDLIENAGDIYITL